MWEAKFCLRMVRCFFPGFSGFRPLLINDQFSINEIFLKGPYHSNKKKRRPIPAPHQYSRNNGHSFCTEKAHTADTPLSYYDIHRQHNSGLIYQQTRRNTFSQYMYRSMGNIPLVPGTLCYSQNSSHFLEINILTDRHSRLDKPLHTERSLDQTVTNCIFQMFKFPNVDLLATRFSHKHPMYVSSVPNNQAFAINSLCLNWNNLHANV